MLLYARHTDKSCVYSTPPWPSVVIVLQPQMHKGTPSNPVSRALFYFLVAVHLCLSTAFLTSTPQRLKAATPDATRTFSFSSTTDSHSKEKDENYNDHWEFLYENIAPIYITIGPPLAGKTTWIHNQTKTIADIALDDQPGVYVSLPSKVFYTKLSPKAKSMLEERKVYGRSLWTRVQNAKELGLVVKRINGELSSKDFSTQMHALFGPANFNATSSVISSYESAIETMSTYSLNCPEHTDLFVPEALFQMHPKRNMTGLESAKAELESTRLTVPVAWGNTNTKSSDYLVALQLAQKQRRPVRFVVYYPFDASANVTTASLVEKTCELPGIGMDGLYRRNIERYIKTGRYIPWQVVLEMNRKTQELLLKVDKVWCQRNNPTCVHGCERKDRDAILASLALAPDKSTFPIR